MLDVVVVGAGPAGSSCAYRLAKRGLAVTILERAAFPRTKVCGEYLSAGAQAELAQIGLSALDGSYPVRAIRLHAHGIVAELPFAQLAASLPRADLDDRLLAHARAAGASLIRGRAERVERHGGAWTVHFRDASGTQATLQSRIVVGADGIGSVVARSAGLAAAPDGAKRFALGGHYRGFDGLENSIEMYVRGKTYFAINPLGAGLANIMVIVNERDLHAWRENVDANLREAAREMAAGRRSVDNLRRVGNRVAVGPLEQRVRAVAQRGLYLVGDAAGFVDPFTGQGVFLALRTASLAADAIDAELRGGAQASGAYGRAHARLMRSRKRVARLVQLLLQHSAIARLAAQTLTRSAPLRRRLMRAVAGA